MTPLQNELSNFFNFVVIQSEGGSLTVKKILLSLILVVLGYIIAKRISYRVTGEIGRRFKFPNSTIATISTIAFYLFYSVIIIFVFRILEIPLTIFTVLGSALAIGVGFGSQNIVKNFLSGITMLVEQPIKVGDFLEVDGLYGVVESIGFRSTIVKTSENTHVVIPNSSFLENKVLNWTLSDDIIRGCVSVGVAYGSDVLKVHMVLESLSKHLKMILDKPEPVIIFSDFGDSALVFEYYFYSKVSTRTHLRRNESEVRFLIYKLFKEHNIVIAFPQLDVHVQNS